MFPGLSKIPPPTSSAVSLKKRATESAPPPSTSNENEDEGQRLEIQESIVKLELIMINFVLGSAKKFWPGCVNDAGKLRHSLLVEPCNS